MAPADHIQELPAFPGHADLSVVWCPSFETDQLALDKGTNVGGVEFM